MDKGPRIALVHDWLTSRGGAERVLEAMLGLFPDAVVHTLFYRPELFRGTSLAGREVRPSPLDRFPWARMHYRSYLPLMPLAVEQFDLSGFDAVISISDAVAHGVLTHPDQLHINYILTPMRYIWDLQPDYLRSRALRSPIRAALFRLLAHYLRLWDGAASRRVDHFVAISRWVAQRVWRCYRRQAEVIYPPVDVDRFRPGDRREDYYVTVGRLVPYKRVDLLVAAFARLGRRLLIVGDGPERRHLERGAGESIRFLGWLPDEEVAAILGTARAFVFAAEEEFGIAPVEAQAAGCPVIAYGRGGARETVIEGETGIFFDEPSADSLAAAVERFEANAAAFDAARVRRNAERFGRQRFEAGFRRMVDARWEAHRQGVPEDRP
jgi:glycosyltransferase involved in cell wall biosynthesis